MEWININTGLSPTSDIIIICSDRDIIDVAYKHQDGNYYDWEGISISSKYRIKRFHNVREKSDGFVDLGNGFIRTDDKVTPVDPDKIFTFRGVNDL